MLLLLTFACSLDRDGDGHPLALDCDDGQVSINPGAAEVCDGIDQDCDGLVDEGVSNWLYEDLDGDGFGGRGLWSCDTGGLVKIGGDCDDSDPAIHPGAPERDCADPVDYNCDGSTRYEDADQDGVPACEDCDDSDAAVLPGAEELCNDVDDDCDGLIDYGAEGSELFYADHDGDGVGQGVAVVACAAPEGHASETGDCDDSNASVHPGAEEVCNDVDDDCDGGVDEDAIDALPAWLDADGDGFGGGDPELQCELQSGWVEVDGDCDDADPDSWPGNPEVCDRADNDCDGVTDFDLWVPDDHGTVREAMTQASAGDHICVDAGTWTESLSFGTKALVVEGAEGAILDGGGANRVAVFEDGSVGTLRGFTLTGGVASSGAAVLVDQSDPTLEDLVIEGNLCVSQTCRGVVHLVDSTATLTDVLIQDNDGGVSGSTVYGVGLSLDSSEPTLDGVTLRDNRAVGSAVWAAALYADDSGGTWSHLDVRGNQASASSFVTATALSLNNSSAPTVENFVLAGNLATTGTAYSVGVWCYSGCSADLVNGVIHGNHAVVSGVAQGVGLTSYSNSSPTLTNVTVSANTVNGSVYGAGVSVVGSSTVSLLYTNVFGNSVNYYGVASPGGANGCLEVNPLYTGSTGADPLLWDFSLAVGSPLIDAGDPALTDPDGTRSDVGAYGGAGGDW